MCQTTINVHEAPFDNMTVIIANESELAETLFEFAQFVTKF